MSDLEQLQADIVAKLNAESYFVDVPVIALRPLSTSTDAAAGELAQEQFWRVKKDGVHSGVGVLVQPITLRVPFPDVPGPQYETVITIDIAEQPLVSEEQATGLNPGRTGKSAEAVALEVARTLHQWSADGRIRLHLRDSAFTRSQQDKRIRAYQINLYSDFNVDMVQRAGMPTITYAAPNVTIAGQSVNDVLYYTVDGSFPSSLNVEATIYSAPFAVTSGVRVRAAAYATGKNGSDAVNYDVP